jgi:hypothetical protein
MVRIEERGDDQISREFVLLRPILVAMFEWSPVMAGC